MATLIPYINPIRIRKSTVIDYSDTLPRFDLMTQRIEYQRGITAQNAYYPDMLINKPISLEIYTNTSVGQISAIIYFPDGTSDTITPEDISPTGWTSEPIISIGYNSNTEGLHYIVITTDDGTYTTDVFLVKYGNTEKDLIEFIYSDTENRLEYGGGFYYGDAGNWLPRAYFTGIKKPIISPREDVVFVDEPGNPITLQITSSKSEQLILTDIHHTYLSVIEEIVKVDTIYINGQLMTVTEISSEPIDDKTDLVNITMTITRADNDGFYNY